MPSGFKKPPYRKAFVLVKEKLSSPDFVPRSISPQFSQEVGSKDRNQPEEGSVSSPTPPAARPSRGRGNRMDVLVFGDPYYY